MIDHVERRFLSFFLALLMIFSTLPLTAFALDGDSVALRDGKIKVKINGGGTPSITLNNDGNVIATTTASTDSCTGSVTAQTATLTISNETNNNATITFEYVIGDNVDGGLTVNGATDNSGMVTATLAAGGTFTAEFTSVKEDKATGTVTLSNFNIVEEKPVNVTAKAVAAEFGSYTVNDEAITADKTINTTSATGVSLVATPAAGYSFAGWYNETTGHYVSFKADVSLVFGDDAVILPKFIPTADGVFAINDARFATLDEALAAANIGSVIRPLKDVTLSKDYTIPKGVTLLVPFDDAGTCLTDTTTNTAASLKTPSVYRTVTLADGVTLTVNGAVSVSAQHFGASGSKNTGGRVSGPYGRLKLNGSSKVDVRSGGTFYAWGYVIGDGEVVANSGATVHEVMQLTEFIGGTNLLGGIGNHKSKKFFIFSQYYVQNIETKVTIHSGAALKAMASVTMSGDAMSMPMTFIGEGGMFTLTNGAYVTKDYDVSKDRLIINSYGDVSVNSISMSLSGTSVNSSDFYLPVNSNISININSGMANVNQDLTMLPGSEINVAKGAQAYVPQGTQINIYDQDDWGNYVFSGKKIAPLTYIASTGAKSTRGITGDAVVNINGIVANAGTIYTSEGGAKIISSEGDGIYVNMVAAPTTTTTVFGRTDGKCSAGDNNVFNPAWLCNADNTYVETIGSAAGTVYVNTDGKWEVLPDAVVTIDPNGGQGTAITQTVPASVILQGTDNKFPVRDASEVGFTAPEHYTFNGWNTADDGSGVAYKVGDTLTITETITLYAQWLGDPYKVYVNNGEPNELAYGTDLTEYLNSIDVPGFVTGYELTWKFFKMEGETKTEITLPEMKMPAHDLYVEGIWEAAKVSSAVTVDGNEISDGYKEGADLNTLLGEFYTGKTVADFNFYSDAECTAPVKIVDGKMPGHALYAKSLYSVTVEDTNGGVELATWELEAGTKLAEKVASVNVQVPVGKKFTGWFLNGEKIDDTTVMSAENIVIQAIYADLFTVTFQVNGSAYGDPFYADENNQHKITIGNPEGENFGGWQDSTGKLYQNGDTITLTENLVLNAHFHADTDPKDHKCDGCDKTGMGTHADGTDNDHVCDYCQGAVDGEVCRGGTATCSAKAICEECGQPYGELDENAHAYATSHTGYVYNNDGTHSAKYVCAYNKEHFKAGEPEPCEFMEGECYYCNYACVHKNEAPKDHVCDICDMALEHCSDVAVYTAGIEAGCHSTGRTESWHCEICDVYYLDAACTQVTNYKRLTILPRKDTADHAPEKAATCTAGGNLEYWFCDECDQVWEDEALTKLSSIEKMQIGALGHSFKTVDAQTATCVAEGNLEHKQCETCKLYFAADAATDSTAGQAENTAFITPKDSSNHANKLKYTNNLDGTHSAVYECCNTPGVQNEKHNYSGGSRVCVKCGQEQIRISAYAPGWDMDWEGNGLEIYKNGQLVDILTLTGRDTADEYMADYYETDTYEIRWHKGNDHTFHEGSYVIATVGDSESNSTITWFRYGGDKEMSALADGQRLYPECSGHNYNQYVDNGDGTHTLKCGECNANKTTENHTYDETAHKCECGAVETFPMHFYLNEGDETPVATLLVPFGTALQTESNKATDELKALAEEASKSLTTTPTKDYYTYDGWEIDWIAAKTMPAEDVTIYASWIAVEYTITYDLNGGQFKDSVWRYDESAIYGEWFYLNAKNEPDVFPVEREGYTFTHFLDQKGAKYEPVCNGFTEETRHWLVGAMPGYDLTLTAQWEINQYTITFKNTGDKEYAPITMDYGKDIAPIDNPEKAGYKFVGWTDENGNSVSIPATMPGKNMTLTAQWEINQYTLTFQDENGNTIGNPVSYEVGAKVTATYPNYSKQNYDISWNAEIPATMPANDVVIKVVATPKSYIIVFGGPLYAADVNNNWTVTVPDDPTQAGYTFAGWATTKDATTADTNFKAGDEIAFTENKTFYPVFTANNFTVTLYGNGGLFGNEETWSVTGACGTAIDYANVQPVREGYDFAGWKLKDEGEIVNLPTKIPTADAEYFAQWTLKQVTVNFDEGETNSSLTGYYFSTVTAPKLEDTESHIFLGWAETADPNAEVKYAGGAPITLNSDVADKTFIAKWEAKKFDVIYYVDGTEVHRDTYAYGAAITQWQGYVPGEGYTFNGWSEIPETMGAANVAVHGTTTVKTYTITWKNEDGSVIDTTTVKHGEMPKRADPTKESTAQYTYTFDRWTPEIVAAKSAAEYTAQFTSKLRSYEITFVVDGVETKVPTNYGEKPVFSGTPEKKSDKQYSYEFAGWDKELEDVTGEATYTATWKQTPVEYTVTFQIGNDVHFAAKGGFGTQIDYTGFVEEPTKTGHTFSGWSMTELPETFSAENLVITGSFNPNQYTIHFYGDISTGAEYDDAFEGFSITKDYDATITEEDLAGLNLPEITGWEFASWQTATVVQDEESEEITLEDVVDREIPEKMPLNGLDLYARWEQEQYDLEVKSSIDGEWIIGTIMVYGESYETLAEFNATNSFCYDSDCAEGDNLLPKGYTFEGYTYEDGSAVQFPYSHPADNVTIIAQFKPIDYTITFDTNGGEPAVIDSITAPYGTEITLPENPTKTGYDFAGWVDAEGNSVNLTTMPLNGARVYAKWTEGNAIFSFFAYEGAPTAYATFEVKTGSDLLTKTPDDSETEEDESAPSVLDALLAQVAEKDEAPVKKGHTFLNWITENVPATMPADGVTVYGDWKINSYTVNADGKTYTFQYGETVSIPEPTKEGHTFNGWNENVPATMPDHDVVLTAKWTVKSYTITFDVEGEAYNDITADYGTEITWPAAPTKTGHTFLGWSTDGETVIETLPVTMPAGGLNLYAVWQTNTVVITWIIDGKETIETYQYGDTMTEPEATKATDAKWSYKFTGWSPALPANGTATVNETYTAQFAEDAKVTYAVKFVDPADDTYSYSTRMAWDAQVNLEALEGFTAPTQTGKTLSWTVNGDEVTFPYEMSTKDVTFVAKWTPITYTIKFYHNAGDTEPAHTISAEYGASVSYEYIAPVGYEFTGWLNKANNAPYTLPETMPAENLELVAVVKAKSYDVIFLEDGNETIRKSVTYSQQIPVVTPITTKGEGYTFQGWFDADGKKLDWNYTMPARDMTFTAKWTYTGWSTDEKGTTYLVNDEKAYFNEIATIGNAQYGFDAEGYIVKDITAFNDKYHAFDHDTGVFLSNLTGIYTASNGDVYYVENGIAAANKGLVRIVGENGHIHYYYFGCSISSNCPSGYQCDPYKAQRNCVHWVENNNGMLVKWDYTFDEDGVIEHQDDTSLNGIQTIGGKKFYLIDGVKVHKGLFKDGDSYYYARSSGELVVNRDYWITNLNGLNKDDKRIHEGTYTFDTEGRMILAEVFTGICEEDGKLFYYLDGVTDYAGLIRYSGDLVMADGTVKKGFYKNDYLYIRTSGELAQGRYWITKNNGLMESKNYEFDSYGRMNMTDGLTTVDGVLYYYKDGTPFYAGLIEIDGAYYYVKTSGQVVTGCSYWITKTNGLMAEKSYNFDESGKMLNPELIDNSKDGLVEENGSLYYYRNGAPYYAGLIEIDGNYYYAKTSGEVVRGQKYWITKNNGLMKSRSYTFDENGVMLDPAPLA